MGMRQVKKRIWSGAVLEQIVYPISDRAKRPASAAPRLRFHTYEERLRHRENIARRRHEELFNANFKTTSIYSTLTFDNEHEIYTFSEAHKVRCNYARRLKYAYPDAVIALYIGRGASTGRIHFHMVSDGVPVSVIMAQWTYGEVVKAVPLRKVNYKIVDGRKVNVGADYSGLANYLFDHWTPEQGGHHYYFSRNRKEPEAEEPKEIRRAYSAAQPPRAPEGYKLIEVEQTSYGYIYFKFVFVGAGAPADPDTGPGGGDRGAGTPRPEA